MQPAAGTQATERVIIELLERGVLRAEIGYLKKDLLKALRSHESKIDPEQAFSAVRELVAGADATTLGVVTSGVRRGTRYHFRKIRDSVDSMASGADQKTKTGPSAGTPPRRVERPGKVEIIHADNMTVLPRLPAESYRLIYIDPPFNTGRVQTRTQISTRRVTSGGDRTGFQGARFESTVLGRQSFADSFDDYLEFLEPRLHEAHRLLTADGSLFLHLDYREVHYAKVLLDQIFGRDSFINEIIWAYDYGARSRRKWSAKHDNILWYAKDPNNYVFDYEAMDRIPYMAPGLVGPEKAARGKTPTDVWWHTIVSPNGKEKTGYPTQKPLGILRRIVSVHSESGDSLLDFFAGSGSFGEAGASLGRSVTLVDSSPNAVEIMRERLATFLATQGEPAAHAASGCGDKPIHGHTQISMF